jgi:O-antigen/teichoic acid export membrane protein
MRPKTIDEIPLRAPRAKQPRRKLTDGRLLAKNAIWSLIGQALPLFVGALIIPSLMRTLGTARFGVLTLAWALIGYCSLFDLGLGRALTKLVAERIGEEDHTLPELIWTALGLMALVGLCGTVLCIGFTPWLVRTGLSIPQNLREEALWSFRIIAVSIPIVVVSTALRGILEAQQEFGYVNWIRIPLGLFTFLAPWITSLFTNSLPWVVFSLLAARCASVGCGAALVLKTVPQLPSEIRLHRSSIRPLLSFGSWMSASNILSPVLVYIDRFLIAALLSVAAVTYYATPFEVVTKLWIVPGAVATVLFPAFSMLMSESRSVSRLLQKGINYVSLLLFPIVLIIVSFAHIGLKLWIGESFAAQSTTVLQILAIGVFLNSIGQIAFACVQALGRPDLTAKVHIVETPLYIALLYLLLRNYGIQGAAVAWLIRVLMDTIAQYYLAVKLLDLQRVPGVLSKSVLLIAVMVGCLGCGYWAPNLLTRELLVGSILMILPFAVWSRVLGAEEKQLVLGRLRGSGAGA